MADFLDEMTSEPVEDTPVVEAQPEVVTQPEPEASTPEAAAEPEPQVEKEPKHVPLGTFLDMRDKLRDAERRAAELEARNRPQPEAPDPYDDPAAYGQHLEEKVQTQVTNLKFQMSDQMARQAHGAETVDKAAEWATERAKTDPAFAMSYMREPHPIDWIVRQHKRDGLLSDIGDNVDDWFTREAQKRGYVAQSAPVAAPIPVVAASAPRQAPPPRSIASDVTAPAAPVLDDNASFGAIFARK